MHPVSSLRATIRPFAAGDYPAVAALHNALFAEMPLPAEHLRHRDEHRPSKVRSARWVAEQDGRVVAYAQYDQWTGTFHPRKFMLDLVVDEAYQGQGIGSALYDLLLESLRPFDPLTVDLWTRADMDCRIGFIEHRGFSPDMRMWSSVLDLERFDPRPFMHHVESIADQGIQIRTLAELRGMDPEVDHKQYDMWSEVREDIPLPPGAESQPVSFDEWLQHKNSPIVMPDGVFLAVDGERYVGTSELEHAPDTELVRTGLTGVRRAYRRRGIAFALKVRALSCAKAKGYRRIVTENAAVNRGMLSINEQLGFVKLPAWVRYVKVLSAE